MSSQSLRRRCIPLLLAAILTASGASAAKPQAGHSRSPAPAAPALAELLDHAWGLLTGLWEEGCHIDPSGCIAQTDEGCNVDPSGRCVPFSASGTPSGTDEGCQIDPDGRCR